MNFRFLMFIFLMWLFPYQAKSQNFYFKAHFGAMYYQGDLAPRPLDLSFGPGNLCWGISGGYGIANWVTINTRFMIGRLSGDDAFADDISRKQRNLSFASPLYEYGLYTDLLVNQVLQGLNKYKIRLYITGGINFIKFNPHAYYKDAWIQLQPLGTEGQTIPGSGKKPYSLSGISRFYGLIVEFDLSKRLSFGMEISPRKTYTDYLDDVSGTYVNYDEMVAAGNPLGAALSNRTGEYLNTGPVSLPTGSMRGRPDKKDWYTHFGIYVKYRLGKDKSEPIFNLPDDSMSKEEVEQKL